MNENAFWGSTIVRFFHAALFSFQPPISFHGPTKTRFAFNEECELICKTLAGGEGSLTLFKIGILVDCCGRGGNTSIKKLFYCDNA